MKAFWLILAVECFLMVGVNTILAYWILQKGDVGQAVVGFVIAVFLLTVAVGSVCQVFDLR